MYIYIYLFIYWRDSSQWARASSFTRFLDHTQWRATLGRTPPDEWSARGRDLYLTTHNSHNWETSMPAGVIRTHNPRKRATANVRLKPRGYRDRLLLKITVVNPFCDWLQSDFASHKTSWRNALPINCNLRNTFHVSAAYSYVHSSLSPCNRLRHVILNCIVMWAITWLNIVRWTINRSFFLLLVFM